METSDDAVPDNQISDSMENGGENGKTNGKTAYRSIDISFRGISLSFFGKPILHDIYGEVDSGEILVVMGPTGAGKTSLMNALSGRRPADKGCILANGKRMTRHQHRMIGYVEQNDTFVSTLTLYDTLKITALLRLPSKMSYKSKMERVQQVIEILELKKCQNTQIGDAIVRGLSGGEKKRTSIGCELLTNPAMLLLDEPTTGLDSSTAYSLMYSIKQFCVKYHKSVIINIHQPSSQIYYMSDKLLLLIDGRVGYYGSSKQVLHHFESIGLHCQPHYNPADFVMDCARGGPETVKKLTDLAKEQAPKFDDDQNETEEDINESNVEGIDNPAFDSSQDDVNIPTKKKFDIKEKFLLQDVDTFYNPDLKYQSSYAMQLFILTLRQLKIYWREQTKLLNMLAIILTAVVVLSLFFGTQLIEENMRERLGFIYFVHIYVMFSATFFSVLVNIACFPVVFKERMSNAYHLSALCLAVFLGDLILGGFSQLLTGLIGYWTTGYRSVTTFFLLALCLMILSASMSALAAFEFTLLNDIPCALLAAILSALFGFLISGLIINPLPIWAAWMKYLVPMGYAYNSVMFEHLEQDFMIACSNGTSAIEGCNMGIIDEFSSRELLRDFDWVIPLPANLIILIFLTIFLRSMNYVMLRYWRTPLAMIMKKPSKLTLAWRACRNRITGKKASPGGPPWGGGGPPGQGPPGEGPPPTEHPTDGDNAVSEAPLEKVQHDSEEALPEQIEHEETPAQEDEDVMTSETTGTQENEPDAPNDTDGLDTTDDAVGDKPNDTEITVGDDETETEEPGWVSQKLQGIFSFFSS